MPEIADEMVDPGQGPDLGSRRPRNCRPATTRKTLPVTLVIGQEVRRQ